MCARAASFFVMKRVLDETVIDKGEALHRPQASSWLVLWPTAYAKVKFKAELHNHPFKICTSPFEAILCADSLQSMHTHMLCGLLQHEQVLRLGAVYASGFLRALRFLQIHWQFFFLMALKLAHWTSKLPTLQLGTAWPTSLSPNRNSPNL